MSDSMHRIQHQYAVEGLLEIISRALVAAGADPACLTPADLAPVDEFHIRGREATIELAAHLTLSPEMTLLDVGCGLGGSARYLAETYGCHVTGLDATGEYIAAAKTLTEWVGLSARAGFVHGDALAMPFPDASYDIVWCEHMQMNIGNKEQLYRECRRVLRPGGKLVFHEIIRGGGGEVCFPVPWAEDRTTSFLAPADELRFLLEAAGFRLVTWESRSEASLHWFELIMQGSTATGGPPPLGLHLLLGSNAGVKTRNQIRNLKEHRISVVLGVYEKK